ALLDDDGLRHVLAATTDHRAFYDALGAVPFEDGRDPSSVLARKAYLRADREPWGPHLRDALSATQKLLRVVGAFARTDPKSLLGRSAAVDLHTVGGPVHPDESLTCGTCAWRHDSSRSVGRSRCRKHPGVRIDASMRACVRWEAVFDCQDCGACCREAYTAVEVKRTEPVVTRYPDLVVREGKYLHLRRAGERCAALEGGRTPAEQYTCRIYDDRPSTCREFALASPNCLDARRAVGLSR
ncbi:MAG: YkgJ family cysteine cluster protein, partial [Myxococcales bacterium]|nr:YkgJ family cysteine cluster protein [Myxococcales bacterium]